MNVLLVCCASLVVFKPSFVPPRFLRLSKWIRQMKTSARFSPWTLHMLIRPSVESCQVSVSPQQQRLKGRPFIRKSLYFSSFLLELQELESPPDCFDVLLWFYSYGQFPRNTKQSDVFFASLDLAPGPCERRMSRRPTWIKTVRSRRNLHKFGALRGQLPASLSWS